jgi:3-hydroxyacyl-CoA dehydrogenase
MTAINEGTSLTVEDGVAIVTLDFPPVNAMSPALMDGLYDALMAALSDDAAKAIVLICAGRTFIAGADLKSLGKVQPKVDFFALQDSIENSPKPTVAALHGTALGGGMETALTFHYRIAVPSARMGLPEVNLGLLPGGGGTQRLPRITGAEAALDLLISGRQVGAKEALTIGLIDRLAAEGALREDAIAFAKELVDAGEPPKRIRDCEAKVAADRKDANLFERFRTSHAKQLNGLDAPQAIVRCVEAAVAGPWEKGLAIERTEFQTLLAGPQSAALRHVFMAERAAQKIPGLRADLPLIPVTKVGIVGAGTMGSGIAMAFLAAGFAVTVVETQQAALDRGVAHITATLQSRVERGKLAADKAEAQIAALTPTLDLSALADADLVVEAIFENLAAKQALFGTLSAIVRPDTILATNTLVPRCRRHRRRCGRARARARDAFLLAGQRHAAARGGPSRKDQRSGARERDGAGQEAGQGGGCLRRLFRIYRQPDAGGTPGPCRCDGAGGGAALGHRQDTDRVRLSDGAVRDAGSCRTGYRLGGRHGQRQIPPRRGWPQGTEERRWLL